MSTIASLIVKIGSQFDGKGFKQAEKETDRVSDAINGLKSSVAGFLAGGAVLAIGKQFIQAASAAEEMQAKFNVVFASTGSGVTAQLREFGKEANRSVLEMQGMAANLGDILKPLGFVEEDAADLSVQLTKLAVDLSSFNDMPMDEALRRLQGTLVGSHENALRFGVVINENTLKAEMAAQGWDRLTGAQFEQAKVQARINLLMKGTTDAQGDAARTANSFANEMRGLQGASKDAAAELGALLLPAASKVTAQASESITVFAEFSRALKNFQEGAGDSAESTNVLTTELERLKTQAQDDAMRFGMGELTSEFSALDAALFGIPKAIREALAHGTLFLNWLDKLRGKIRGVNQEFGGTGPTMKELGDNFLDAADQSKTLGQNIFGLSDRLGDLREKAAKPTTKELENLAGAQIQASEAAREAAREAAEHVRITDLLAEAHSHVADELAKMPTRPPAMFDEVKLAAVAREMRMVEQAMISMRREIEFMARNQSVWENLSGTLNNLGRDIGLDGVLGGIEKGLGNLNDKSIKTINSLFGKNGQLANTMMDFFGVSGPWGLAIGAGLQVLDELGIGVQEMMAQISKGLGGIIREFGDAIGIGGGGKPSIVEIKLGDIATAFRDLQYEADIMGAAFDGTASVISTLEQTLMELRQNGVGPANPEFARLHDLLKDVRNGTVSWREAIEELNAELEAPRGVIGRGRGGGQSLGDSGRTRDPGAAAEQSIEDFMAEFEGAMSDARLLAESLNEEFDEAAFATEFWKDAIRDWINAGGEAGAVLDFLTAMFRDAEGAAGDLGRTVREWTGIIRDIGIEFGGGGPSRSREGTGLGGGITPGSGVETVLQHIMGIVEQEFMRLGELASAYSQMGVDFDLAGEQAGFLKRMIAELAVEHGTNSEVVQALIKQYNELTKGQKELTDEEVEQMRLEKERIRIQEDLNERIARANAELAVTGDEADHARDTMNALTEALIQLEQAGLGSSDLFADLMKQLKELEGAVKDTDLTPPGSGDGGGAPGSTTIQGDLNIEFPGEMVVSVSGGELVAMIDEPQFDDITGLLEEIKAAILFASDLPGNLEQKLEDFRVAFDSATDGLPGMGGDIAPTTGSLMPAMTMPTMPAAGVPGAAQMGGPQASGGMAAPVVNLTALIEVDGESLMVPITRLMRGA